MTGVHKADTLYVFIAIHADGTEGIMAAWRGRQWVPMVVTDPKLLEPLKEECLAIALAIGAQVVMRTFKTVETVPVESGAMGRKPPH
jgi:hypothetical protein